MTARDPEGSRSWAQDAYGPVSRKRVGYGEGVTFSQSGAPPQKFFLDFSS